MAALRHQVLTRLVTVMAVFPALTPAAVWALPWEEWLIIRDAADEVARTRRTEGARR